jgi:5-methylcytosine-specific restriction protein A
MPPKPMRVCKGSRCLALTREGYCPKCKPKARRQSDRLYDSTRGSARQRGYTREWEKIRRVVLNEEPFCKLCGHRAVDVDHIKPLGRGGTNARENLQPLCRACHNVKTHAEREG